MMFEWFTHTHWFQCSRPEFLGLLFLLHMSMSKVFLDAIDDGQAIYHRGITHKLNRQCRYHTKHQIRVIFLWTKFLREFPIFCWFYEQCGMWCFVLFSLSLWRETWHGCSFVCVHFLPLSRKTIPCYLKSINLYCGQSWLPITTGIVHYWLNVDPR